MGSIASRLESIEEKIEAACRRSGRNRQEIKLMGVTKFQSIEAVEEAYTAGLRLFGESRVQEGRQKFLQFWENRKLKSERDETELHLIGSLQRNKAKAAIDIFDCIHSVDRDSLIHELGVLTEKREHPLMIMLEYHTGEETKAGFPDMDSLLKAAEELNSYGGLMPAGLMTMAPFTR